jgi:hypothetical protein
VGHRTVLDVVMKRKIPGPRRESNPRTYQNSESTTSLSYSLEKLRRAKTNQAEQVIRGHHETTAGSTVAGLVYPNFESRYFPNQCFETQRPLAVIIFVSPFVDTSLMLGEMSATEITHCIFRILYLFCIEAKRGHLREEQE